MTAIVLAWLVSPVFAGTPWQHPPEEILEVLNAPEIPTALPDPTDEVLFLLEAVRYPPLADKAAPMHRVAGLRIDARTGTPHGQVGAKHPVLKTIADGREVEVKLPPELRVLDVSWSADGERYALSVKHDDHVGLWIGDRTGAVAEVAGLRLNGLLGSSVQWLPDQDHLLVKRSPEGHGAPPAPPLVPEGPLVKATQGGRAASTYEARDLITSAYDEHVFTYYAESELAVVDAADGAVRVIGEPDVYAGVQASPNGKHLLVQRLVPPWSYATAWYRFAQDFEVWTLDGEQTRAVVSLAVEDSVPAQGVAEGPRSMTWRDTADATLVWVEALDGGDPKNAVPARDRLMTLKAPFTSAPTELFRAQHRVTGWAWGAKGLLLVEQNERERRWRHVWTLNADAGAASAKKLFDLSENDSYADPGYPLQRVTPDGRRVLRQDGDALYYVGSGSTPAGDRPFLDRRSLRTGQVERLFRSSPSSLERVASLIDPKAGTLLVRRESPTEVPNLHLVTLGAKITAEAGEAAYARTDRPVTTFVDPLPKLREVQKRLVTFEREDGTPLSFMLYLPPGYVEGTRLPTVLNAYPREFSDPSTAGQVTGSDRTFDRFGGPTHLFFALHGYAVLHNATMPVIGDPETAYDSFVEQLVSNADAAIAEAVRLGVTDPDRVGVMGHSHGGLMTATLIAHSDLFRAGIARSGAYNHTIRPFGFQNERRTLWEAPGTYANLSPVMHAPKINEPLLIIHGAIDENPGTVPLQSERLFEAIRGTGGTARLLMLPYEGHGYTARESVEHTLAEQLAWFDTYVRDAAPRAVAKP